MSWATGLILWLLGGMAAMWLFGQIASRFGRPDEIDHLAERKRQIAKRARQQSGEFQ